MSLKTTLTLLVAASLAATVGCKKNDPAPSGSPDNGAAAPGPTTAAAPAAGEVSSYPSQVNMGSITRQTLQPFTVHQAADNNSATIGHVCTGVWINIKASYSNWFLV